MMIIYVVDNDDDNTDDDEDERDADVTNVAAELLVAILM